MTWKVFLCSINLSRWCMEHILGPIYAKIFLIYIVLIYSRSPCWSTLQRNKPTVCSQILWKWPFTLSPTSTIAGPAGVWAVEVVQQPHPGRGLGGVPLRAGAFQPAAHPAAPAAAALLFHQLIPRSAPIRNPPHCGCCLLPRKRSVNAQGWKYISISIFFSLHLVHLI